MLKLYLILIGIMCIGCSQMERPIVYGVDSCNYCKMTIVDAKFAAQLVTTKGKIYTYDAIECLINQLHEHSPENIHKMVVHSFDSPDDWITVTQGKYAIHPDIQSPMGANLACFNKDATAENLFNIPKEALLSWEEIKLKTFKLEH